MGKSRHKAGRNTRDPLSRDERAAIGGEAGFSPLQPSVRCPDCRDVELSLNTLEDPFHPQGRKLGFRRSYRCPTCNGYGEVSAPHKQRVDQYLLPRRG